MSDFYTQVQNLRANAEVQDHATYQEGFWLAREQASEIAAQADELIKQLADALEDLHDDHVSHSNNAYCELGTDEETLEQARKLIVKARRV